MTKSRIHLSLWLVLFVAFIDYLGLGLVYPLFSSILFEPEGIFFASHASSVIKGGYLGILLAAMPLTSFFSSPILGALSDQKGRRPLFIFSLLFTALGYTVSVISIITTSLPLLIFSRIITGLGGGSLSVVSATVADLSEDPAVKTKNFGLYGMACGVGFTLGPFLGGILSTWSISLPFLIAGLATLLNLGLIWIYFKETHLVRKNAAISFASGIQNVKKAFQLSTLRALFLASALFCLGWSFFYEFLPVIWISDYGFNKARIGLLFAYGAAVYALSSGVLIRPIINRFGSYPTLFYSLGALGISILLLLLPTTNGVWFFLPITNFLSALVFPTASSAISDLADKNAQGEILGMYGSLQSLAFAISPLSAGFLAGVHSHIPSSIGSGAILLAALLVGVSLRRRIWEHH